METALQQNLERIETGVGETAAAIAAQGGILRIAVRQLAELIELLTPKEADADRVPLDELLAQLIQQNAEQLALTHRLVEAINRLEQTLPERVADAVLSRGGVV